MSTVKVCWPCHKGWRCCGKAWGKCVCYVPTFGTCCRYAPDVACEAQNIACRAIIDPLKAALDIAKEAVDKSRHSLDVAIAALEVIKVQVSAAQVSLDAAIAALEVVEQTYRVGVEATKLIVRLQVQGVIDIREITFDASLSVANTGKFQCSVRATFAGLAEVTVGVAINLRDLTSIAKELANKVLPGLSDFL